MEPSFWHERWQKGDIGFHRDAAHAALDSHWRAVGVAPPAVVFVPLCGKSLDMAWLAGKGYRVLGVELSQLAVDAFFESQNLTPSTRQQGTFAVSTAGPFELWCGDLFALPADALREVGAVYDRASLVALPPATQHAYADWLSTMTGKAPILLVGLAYDEAEMDGPPFSVPQSRVRELLSANYDLDVLSDADVIEANVGMKKRGLTALQETVYRARRKT
ncbi:MAG: thiopurine S-methyltransferase [Alphaproteobacteria bacterium BRH_c36]|nr:MAG: thiopurine S-methyltransferase [Alphaproteobacteria bacterium BRH_c36]